MKTLAAIAMAVALAASCQPQTAAPPPAPKPPLLRPTPKPADTSVAVASGNTAAAADIAALAALRASFDPQRDPARDLLAAEAMAQPENRRIVLDVGGEWCSWCHVLDDFVEGDAQIRRLRDARFVWVKVNFSPDNENKAFLAGYPTIDGYPHLFVLDAQGHLLLSQSTAEFEHGKGYNRKKFLAFLQKWAQ